MRYLITSQGIQRRSNPQYKTSLLSNQEALGNETNALASIAYFADFKANLNKLLTSSRLAESQIKHDGNLLPYIQSALKENQAEFSFDIIHLMGTHFNYDRRYPQEFAKFNTKDIDYPPYATNKEKEMIATYANAVLYNDYIVHEIFKIYSQEEAIILYISDRGESLYEHKGKLGHFFHFQIHRRSAFCDYDERKIYPKPQRNSAKIRIR
ncbi:MAG: sulfatase-like hydrolase/transferase [Lachnospiraceae bacterium]|nr:sulfatase-like hydrolase/transferase [Lachnospiraceae bacterium]